MEKSVNTHNRLRHFLTNKIFLLQVTYSYRYVHTIFIVNCVKITLFFIAYAALWWKSMVFIVLSSLETVHDTVQYRCCIFSLFHRLWRIRLKRQNPLLSNVRERERQYTANVHSVQHKSIGLKFSKSRTGSDVRYSCHHNSSCFTFSIFAHSWRFYVFHSLQSITPRIY